MSVYDGNKYGRLTVLRTGKTGRNYWCDCICDCGNTVRVYASSLSSGNTKSCGCLRRELTADIKSTHKQSKTRLYRIWKAMRKRCNNPSDWSYPNYGALGVKVCEEWESFSSFATWAKTHGYNENLTIDRIDPTGNYEPDNCKWSTRLEQARNKRDSVLVTIGDETKPLVEWCKEKGVVYGTALYRLKKLHLSGEDLFQYQRPRRINIFRTGWNSGDVWAEE